MSKKEIGETIFCVSSFDKFFLFISTLKLFCKYSVWIKRKSVYLYDYISQNVSKYGNC
jgi:hypothetical protein